MEVTDDPTAETDSLGTFHWLALILVLLTGAIHVYAGVSEGRIPVALAGVGFLGAAALFLLNYRRSLLYPLGVLYTAVQGPLWVVVKAGEYTTLGYVDKAIQGVLIVILIYLIWTGRQGKARS
jgi:hypothetical protein